MASRYEIVPALVAGDARAHTVLVGCGVNVTGFLGSAAGTGMVGANALDMGGV